jgi:hypothetical protein
MIDQAAIDRALELCREIRVLIARLRVLLLDTDPFDDALARLRARRATELDLARRDVGLPPL